MVIIKSVAEDDINMADSGNPHIYMDHIEMSFSVLPNFRVSVIKKYRLTT